MIQILLLHGLGGDQTSMLPVAKRLNRSLPAATCHAVEGDYREYPPQSPDLGWFHPPSDSDRRVDSPTWVAPQHLEHSLGRVQQTVESLIAAGEAANQIFLLGHSQGGAMAIAAGLACPYALGGVCTIAGYLPAPLRPGKMALGTPYFLQHVEQDPIVSVRWGRYAADYLREQALSCELKCWEIETQPHAMHPRQIDAAARWIAARVSLNSAD
ncbi:alpha/beta hydrolase [Planctomycetaceae bacterium SH139]